MANETKIELKGNFIVASNITTRDEFFRLPRGTASFKRNRFDEFLFLNSGQIINNYGSQHLNTLGLTEAWSYQDQEPSQQSVFTFSNIVDFNGDPFPSADALDDWLSENLGVSDVLLSGAGYLTYVAHDATLSGDGTAAFPLSVVPVATYQERWDILTSLVGGAWHTIPTRAPPRSLLTVVFDSNVNDNTCGARAVGSGLNRGLQIDRDSTCYFVVEADSNGDIEIFTTSTNCIIRVESYL